VSFSHLAFLSGADGIENSFPFYFGAMMNGYFVDARPSLYEYQSAFSLSLCGVTQSSAHTAQKTKPI